MTTTDSGDAASTVHGVPVHLLATQAHRIGLGLQTIPMRGKNVDGYVEIMRAAAAGMRAEGVEAVAFGDLDSSGGRAFREELFGPLGLDVLEPLEGMSSQECIDEFLVSGHQAALTPAGSLGSTTPSFTVGPCSLLLSALPCHRRAWSSARSVRQTDPALRVLGVDPASPAQIAQRHRLSQLTLPGFFLATLGVHPTEISAIAVTVAR